jgi:hypothetical protein
MPLFNELDATTLKVIQEHVVYDYVFLKKSKLLERMRNNAQLWGGGSFLQNMFLYAKTIGGPYGKGGTFDTTFVPMLDGAAWDLKYYYQNVTEFLEQIRVEAVGEANAVDLAIAHCTSAAMTMNENLAIEMYLHGQPSGTTIASNRVLSINGFAEQYNNGIDNAWNGDIFPVYGKQTRTTTIPGNNSTPYWGGDQLGNPGQITYPTLTLLWANAKGGDYVPDTAVMNKALFIYTLQRIQPQQQLHQEANFKWGTDSWHLLSFDVLQDDYCPSLLYGKSDPRTGSFLTSSFTSTSTPSTASNIPASTTLTVGEVMFLFNSEAYYLIISEDELFNFGWTGFKEAQNSNIVAGQTLFAGNVINNEPWTGISAYGFNS